MSQRTKGIYGILNTPFLYGNLQNLFWKKGKRKEFVETCIKPFPSLRVLDIGCGTGLLYEEISKINPHVYYVGLDLNSSYVDYAALKYPNAQFFCADVSNIAQIIQEKFNVIVILNVLHHLDDVSAEKLLQDCQQYLQENGRILTLDPVRTQKAPLMERLMIKYDRGKHIRTAEEYKKLGKTNFGKIVQEIKKGFLKTPMTVSILEFFIDK